MSNPEGLVVVTFRHGILITLVLAAVLPSLSSNVLRDEVWNARACKFEWLMGEITLPPGWTYVRDQGTDSWVGRFISPDGELVIAHDIGGMAGLWTTPGSSHFEERLVGGARVWTGQRLPHGGSETRVRYGVTFPDNGHANFFLHSSDAEDAWPIAYIARTFQSKRVIKSDWP